MADKNRRQQRHNFHERIIIHSDTSKHCMPRHFNIKPSGVFVLNIADVAEARQLERDARKLATEVGFKSAGFYKLAMSINPKLRKAKTTKHIVSVSGAKFKYEPVFVFQK